MENVMIILNYNDFFTVNNYIERIKGYKNIDKIVIVDNLSTDNSYENLKKIGSDKIDIIQTKYNGGYSYGNNFGIKYVNKTYHPKYVTISNPDIIIEENDISTILRSFDKNEDVAVATGLMYNKNNKLCKNSGLKIPNFFQCIMSEFTILSKVLNIRMYNIDKVLKREYYEVEIVPGSFLICDMNKIIQSGLYDEETFLYGEERILGCRLKCKGYKTILATNARYIHFHGETINKEIQNNFIKYDMASKSKIIYMKKYLKANNAQIKIYEAMHKISKLEKFIIFNLNKYKSNYET
ncbi:glycosyltransferase family 2 protein [uncultured Clostridium sp.]|uniref:glycosyltransferase n=1 Tax=uncultured Clostridium sp. TaxID=59620 RepID=UPI0025D2459A|nr:glycosyltransferase family 2 protein [uncultured Clostridium sp.]